MDEMTVALSVGLALVLAYLSWIDWQYFRLPDALTLPLGLAGLAMAAVSPPASLVPHLIGATVGFVPLALFGALYFRATGRDGLGLGDAKLLGAAGAWLGWTPLPFVLLLASLAGLATAAFLGRRSATDRIAFGPFIAGSFMVVWLVGAPGQPPPWR